MNKRRVIGWNSPVIIHPGEILMDMLVEKRKTQTWLAKRTRLSQQLISKIARGEGPITKRTAKRLSSRFLESEDYWNNLQKNYEEDVERLANASFVQMLKKKLRELRASLKRFK